MIFFPEYSWLLIQQTHIDNIKYININKIYYYATYKSKYGGWALLIKCF